MPIGGIEAHLCPRLDVFSRRLAQANLAAAIVANDEDGPVCRQGYGVRVAECHVLDILAVVHLDVVGDSAECQERRLATLGPTRQHPPEVQPAALGQGREGIASCRDVLDWLPKIGQIGYDARLVSRSGRQSVCCVYLGDVGLGPVSRIVGDVSSEAVLEAGISQRGDVAVLV